MIILIAKLIKLANNLTKVVSDNAHTKLKIKTGVKDLKEPVEHLDRKFK